MNGDIRKVEDPNEDITKVKWIETTLRKGTKLPKISKESFVNYYNGEYIYGQTKLGREWRRRTISRSDAMTLIQKHGLEGVKRDFFGRLTTYRKPKCHRLCEEIKAAHIRASLI